jgi:hypothetical protein
MKAATLYERGNEIIVHSSSETTAGVWVLSAPVLKVEKDDTVGIGRAIRECLGSSSRGVPHPKTFSGLFDPVLALAGVRFFGDFMKSSKCVQAEMHDGMVTLIPTRNEGPHEGFVPLPSRCELTLGSDEKFGLAAITTLSVAT